MRKLTYCEWKQCDVTLMAYYLLDDRRSASYISSFCAAAQQHSVDSFFGSCSRRQSADGRMKEGTLVGIQGEAMLWKTMK